MKFPPVTGDGEYLVFNPYGSFYTRSEASRASWQALIDENLNKLRASWTKHSTPSLPLTPIAQQFMSDNLFKACLAQDATS